MAGKFITLEGIDGAGKSTHHDWLVKYLKARGLEVVATREPGGTPLGEKLRSLLLSESMHQETEALLMFASRKEHLEQLILPSLRAGKWVVSDRFTDASYAYQGAGRGMDQERLEILENWVQAGFRPDLTFVFDVPAEIACQRLSGSGKTVDRFEKETLDFFQRIRLAYLRLAEKNPERIRVIDAGQSIGEIQKQLELIITTTLF